MTIWKVLLSRLCMIGDRRNMFKWSDRRTDEQLDTLWGHE